MSNNQTIKDLRVKNNETSIFQVLPIGADAVNVELANRRNLQETIGNIDSRVNGSITNNLEVLSSAIQTLDSIKADTAMIGSPLVAGTASEMTDTSHIYVYTGNESGYTNGNWYYYDGTIWASGGVYNSTAVETDKTLKVENVAADSKATGNMVLVSQTQPAAASNKIWIDPDAREIEIPTMDDLNELKDDLSEITEEVFEEPGDVLTAIDFVARKDLNEISEVVGTETVDVYEYTPVSFTLATGSWENRGVVFTQNSDGTVIASGTNQHPTAGLIFGLRSSDSVELTLSLTAGDKYRLSGCPLGGSSSTYSVSIRYTSGGGPLFRDTGSGVVFDVPETTTYKIHIIVAFGVTINKTFLPKLEKMTVIGQETVDVLSAKDTVARDGKVDKQQAIADAGKVLAVDTDGVLRLSEIAAGLTNEVKNALLACFRHVSWLDDEEDYYAALELALDVEPERYLLIDFTPGNHTVYANDSLDTLIPYLTVTYYEGVIATVLSSDDYSLSGSLQIGSNTISVSYTNLNASFDVTAIDFYNVWTWEYKSDGTGNLIKKSKDSFDMSISGILRGIFTGPAATFSKTRTFITDRGKAPMRVNSSPYAYFTPYMYPVPVPKTATQAICTVTPSNYKMCVFVFRYLNDQTLTQYDYTQVTSKIDQVGTATLTFSARENTFLSMYVNNSDTTSIVEEPEFKIVFS